ncbi:MAG: hypothetical protein JSW67_11590 [Candidatus Latescibacterota bacterium]|nr:MAG: hypothetical protein JSW67_11590 [Candidatus Latescibacterota bacterium]
MRLGRLLSCVFLFVACAAERVEQGPTSQEARSETMVKRPIADVLEEHAPRLMALEGVVMVYESALDDGTPCIKVGVAKQSAALDKKIPDQLEGHAVVVVETGAIEPR